MLSRPRFPPGARRLPGAPLVGAAPASLPLQMATDPPQRSPSVPPQTPAEPPSAPASVPAPDVVAPPTLEEMETRAAGFPLCFSKDERELTAWLVSLVKALLDLVAVLNRRPAELTEAFLLKMVEWVERVGSHHLTDSADHTNTFLFSPHYRGQPIPSHKFGSINRQKKRAEEAAAGISGDDTMVAEQPPMRLMAIDELGKMWVRLHGCLQATSGSRLSEDCARLRFRDLCACLPDLAVLCSGSGVVQARHAELVSQQRCPETAYFNTDLPRVEATRPLTGLKFGELAQTLQVVNFCKFSVDYLGPLGECLRVLVVCLARCMQFSPPSNDTAAVVRRQMVLLLGMAADVRRVRRILRPEGTPSIEKEVVVSEDTLLPLSRFLGQIAQMNTSEPIQRERAAQMSSMIVRRHDYATYRSVSFSGLTDPNSVASELWGNTYGSIYDSLTRQTLQALLAYRNLAPEFRFVTTLFVFKNYYVNACDGAEDFLLRYARFRDTTTDSSRTIVPPNSGPMPPRVANRTYQPMFVCVGNVFAVYYQNTLYTAANDATRLVYQFLRILRDDWQHGAARERDLYETLIQCAMIAPSDHEQDEQRRAQEQQRLHASYEKEKQEKRSRENNLMRPGGKYYA